MHTSIMPKSHEGLMRSVHLVSRVGVGGAFHCASPCAATARDLGQLGLAGHRQRVVLQLEQALCACTDPFGLLNLGVTLLCVKAHLPEIPSRTMTGAWITFMHTAVSAWGLISPGLISSRAGPAPAFILFI